MSTIHYLYFGLSKVRVAIILVDTDIDISVSENLISALVSARKKSVSAKYR